jgi:hypothetical protein
MYSPGVSKKDLPALDRFFKNGGTMARISEDEIKRLREEVAGFVGRPGRGNSGHSTSSERA